MRGSIKVKCVLLGTENSGKSSLVNRCIDDTFNKENHPTIGCAFNIKKFNLHDRKISLEIWDTGGAEHYSSLLPMYYRNAEIILICIDLSKYYNNQDIINKWVNDIDQHVDVGSKIVYIVGTKSDIKKDFAKKTLDNAFEKYPEFIYMETSSKNDMGVCELFNNCVEQIIKQIYESEKINNYGMDFELLPEEETCCFAHKCNI